MFQTDSCPVPDLTSSSSVLTNLIPNSNRPVTKSSHSNSSYFSSLFPPISMLTVDYIRVFLSNFWSLFKYKIRFFFLFYALMFNWTLNLCFKKIVETSFSYIVINSSPLYHYKSFDVPNYVLFFIFILQVKENGQGIVFWFFFLKSISLVRRSANNWKKKDNGVNKGCRKHRLTRIDEIFIYFKNKLYS